MNLTALYDNICPIFGEHLIEGRHGNNTSRYAP